MPKIKKTLPESDLRKAFVDGAKWWEFRNNSCSMWQNNIRHAEYEAEKRYGKHEERCIECGEIGGNHLFGCKMPKLD